MKPAAPVTNVVMFRYFVGLAGNNDPVATGARSTLRSVLVQERALLIGRHVKLQPRLCRSAFKRNAARGGEQGEQRFNLSPARLCCQKDDLALRRDRGR